MEWSNDDVLELVAAYKARPLLWDPTNKYYKLINKKNEAWEEIASSFRLDPMETKKKMNSLLSSFRRERQKEKMIAAKGCERTDVQRSTWFAFKSMSFLMEKFRRPKTQESENEDQDGDMLEDTKYEDYDLHAWLDADNKEVVNDVEAADQPRVKHFLSPPPEPAMTKRVRRDPGPPSCVNRDESAAFGEYIANKTRGYSPYTRNIVQHLVSNILFEADMGKYDRSAESQTNRPLSPPLPSSPIPSPIMYTSG